MTNVNWTIKAQTTLDSIYEYLHQEAPFYAKRVTQEIIQAVDRLESFPLSGRLVPEANREDIREVIFQNYRIIYWVINEERLDIITVLHASRDLNNPEHQPWNSPS